MSHRGILAGAVGGLVIAVALPAAAFADDGTFTDPGGSGPGIPGWFVGFAVLVVALGIGTTIWRVSTARRIAQNAGLDPDQAASMALLTKDGLDATYLAANLRPQPPAASPGQPATPSAALAQERLANLKQLLDRNLISQAEYDQRRTEIINSL
jgi:hypothetical protein